jgi:polar amino acid transport system substrate-binding protein
MRTVGVEVQFTPYRTPGELADAADSGDWRMAMIGADPARSERIAFTAPYVQIEATYLVPPTSALRHCVEVDRPGHVIAAFAGSAYALWLRRNLQYAQLVTADGFETAFNRFRSEGLTALACLKAGLLEDQKKWPGAHILEGSFMQVQQAVGTQKAHLEAAMFLRSFVEDAKSRGLVRKWIDKHKADALSVSPLAAAA